MSSFAPFQQSAWSLTSPFTKREFQFTHHTARSRAVTKSLLEPVLALGVKWALKQGATNVPVPTYGELVVTLFDSSEGAHGSKLRGGQWALARGATQRTTSYHTLN